MNIENQIVKDLIIELKEKHNLSFREIKNYLNMNGVKMTHVAIWEIYNNYLSNKIANYLHDGGEKA